MKEKETEKEKENVSPRKIQKEKKNDSRELAYATT